MTDNTPASEDFREKWKRANPCVQQRIRLKASWEQIPLIPAADWLYPNGMWPAHETQADLCRDNCAQVRRRVAAQSR